MLSCLEDPDSEDRVEIRLTGRLSEQVEGVADGVCSLLLREAVDREGDSGERRDDMMKTVMMSFSTHNYAQ